MNWTRFVLGLLAATLVGVLSPPRAFASIPGCSSGTSVLCDTQVECSIRNISCSFIFGGCTSTCVGYITRYYYWEPGMLPPGPTVPEEDPSGEGESDV